jgi:hypothetical protein
MQAKTVSKLVLLGVGGAAAAILAGRARRRHRDAVSGSDWREVPDPQDPVQGFDEMSGFHVEPYDLDAEPYEEAEIIVDEAEIDLDEPTEELEPAPVKDTGDLYGAHMTPATDHNVARAEPDGFEHADEGESWTEALRESAVEGGAIPEREIVADDELYRPPHPTEHRDKPVADKGSGGRGGL